MMRQTTVVGWAFFRGDSVAKAQAIAEIVDALHRLGGNVWESAHDLGMSRMHLYRIIRAANLWSVVDAARRNHVVNTIRTEPDWLIKARKELNR